MKDKFAEFFASGYAIRCQLMNANDDWRKPLKEFAAEIRAALPAHLDGGVPIFADQATVSACGSMDALRAAMASPPPGRRGGTRRRAPNR